MDALEGKQAAATTNIPDKEWKFSEILADHKIRARWEKVRQYLLFSYYNAVAHTHRYGLHDLSG